MVRGAAENALNAMLDAGVDQLIEAKKPFALRLSFDYPAPTMGPFPDNYFLLYGLALLIVTGCAAAVAAFFRSAYTGDTKLRVVLMRLFLFFFASLYGFLAVELYFSMFVVQSDGFGITLTAQKWFARHWSKNSFGYRDVERNADELAGKKLVVAPGDSFTAGHGIADLSHRYSNVLDNMLGENWVVANVAINGWATDSELLGLAAYPHRPDVVVLAWYINDIETAANATGQWPEKYYGYPSRAYKYLGETSYLFNFLYWRFYRIQNLDFFELQWLIIRNSFSDKQTWALHAGQIDALIDYIREKDIALVAVVMPHLMDIKGSRPITSRVASYIEAKGVPVIDMSPLLSGQAPREIVVNSLDSHPNETVHEMVARLLFEKIRALPVKQEAPKFD